MTHVNCGEAVSPPHYSITIRETQPECAFFTKTEMKRYLICIFAALFQAGQGMDSDEESDQCDSGTQINMPYQRRTMYPQLYPETADCPTRARALTVILGQRKCSKRLVNWHRLRGTGCEKGEGTRLE